jgi:hypothetical protein
MSKLLEKYKINPYDYLGIDENADMKTIKKAYKYKAKIYHPDKNGGKTDVEFKILVLCYKHAKQNCVSEVVVRDFNELKEQSKVPQEVYYEKSFYETDFNDPETRKEIFADDDIDFESFEKEMKRIQSGKTSYSAENFYNKNIIDSMKTNGKFDRDKFNAYFLKLKKEGKIQDLQLVKVDEVKAYNDDSKYMKVNVYDNMIINTDGGRKEGNYIEFRRTKKISNKDMEEIINTDTKVIDKLIKENKKNTGKMSRKKIKELVQKAGEKIDVKYELSAAEMEEKMELENIQRIRRELEEQKQVVMSNRRIYGNRIEW